MPFSKVGCRIVTTCSDGGSNKHKLAVKQCTNAIAKRGVQMLRTIGPIMRHLYGGI